MNEKLDAPDFRHWQHDTLAKFSAEVYSRLQDEIAANDQLRADLKDAMRIVRKQLMWDNRS